MAFYRKNIGSVQQMARIVMGAGVAIASIMLVGAPISWLGVGAGAMFAMTGIVGWCPACAIAGVGGKG